MLLLAALLVAGLAEVSLAGEKIQFSGRSGGGKPAGLQPDRQPAFSAPEFFNGPRLGANPGESLAVQLPVVYPTSTTKEARDQRDRRKDWVLGDRDDQEIRDKDLSPEGLLNRLATDRKSAEGRPQSTMERIMNEQERSRLSTRGSTTNDVLMSRNLTGSIERPSSSLIPPNTSETPNLAGGAITNGYLPFRSDSGAVRLPGAAGVGAPGGADNKAAGSFQLRGAGFNGSFIDQSARVQEFKRLLNPDDRVPFSDSAAGSAGVRGNTSLTGNPSGGRGVAELPNYSSERSGVVSGGSFSGAASGRPALLNDLNSMRLGTPAQAPPVPKPAEPARRERMPTILEIPQRKF